MKQNTNKLLFYFSFSGKGENQNPEKNVQRLYSNPANCNDIAMLRNTLNGYYLVNSSGSVGRFGVAFCQFKLPPGANGSILRPKDGIKMVLNP